MITQLNNVARVVYAKRLLLPVLCFMLLAISGSKQAISASYPSETEREEVIAIKVDKTTKAEILNRFGQPDIVNISPERIVWEYKSAGTRFNIILDNDNGLVRDFTFRKQNTEASVLLKPAEIENSELKDMDVKALIAKYGKPTVMDVSPTEERWSYRSEVSTLEVFIDRQSELVKDFSYRYAKK